MWSDRVERIATCMDELARVRRTFGKHHPQAMIIEVGEMDQLSELHRLLWEEQHDDRSSDGETTGPYKT
jgi:type II secretory pathway component PulJ